jgi:transposase
MVALNADGNIILQRERATSAPNVIELVTAVPGPRQVFIEECHMAQWVYSFLRPYADKVVVCDPRENKWIANASFNDDRTSAYKLAKLGQMKAYKEVYHPINDAAVLRSYFLDYYQCGHELTRCENRIGAACREVGVSVRKNAYAPDKRDELLARLHAHPANEFCVRRLFKLLDQLQRDKAAFLRKATSIARKNPAYNLLQTIPGIGQVLTAGYIATIVTPHRFATEGNLWTYGGFGVRHRQSGGRSKPDKACSEGNRVLKWIVSLHFNAVVRRKDDNRFKRYHLGRLQNELNAAKARRTTCRHLLSVVRAVWRNEQPYDDNHVSEP